MSDPRIWGSDLWKTLHRYSLIFPRSRPSQEMKQAARDFYGSHRHLLPCPWCRHHYTEHFNATFTDETVSSRKALVKWVFDLHNEVNKRLGKPVPNITVNDLPRLYNSFPLRYVDMWTGNLLEEPRYETTEGRDCPSDEEALKKLQKKLSDEEDSDDDDNDDKEKDDTDDEQVKGRKGRKGKKGRKEASDDGEGATGGNKNNNRGKEGTEDTGPKTSTVRDATLEAGAAAPASFWGTPLGVSLLWMMGLGLIAVVVALVYYAMRNRRKSTLSRVSYVPPRRPPPPPPPPPPLPPPPSSTPVYGQRPRGDSRT